MRCQVVTSEPPTGAAHTDPQFSGTRAVGVHQVIQSGGVLRAAISVSHSGTHLHFPSQVSLVYPFHLESDQHHRIVVRPFRRRRIGADRIPRLGAKNVPSHFKACRRTLENRWAAFSSYLGDVPGSPAVDPAATA